MRVLPCYQGVTPMLPSKIDERHTDVTTVTMYVSIYHKEGNAFQNRPFYKKPQKRGNMVTVAPLYAERPKVTPGNTQVTGAQT